MRAEACSAEQFRLEHHRRKPDRLSNRDIAEPPTAPQRSSSGAVRASMHHSVQQGSAGIAFSEGAVVGAGLSTLSALGGGLAFLLARPV